MPTGIVDHNTSRALLVVKKILNLFMFSVAVSLLAVIPIAVKDFESSYGFGWQSFGRGELLSAAGVLIFATVGECLFLAKRDGIVRSALIGVCGVVGLILVVSGLFLKPALLTASVETLSAFGRISLTLFALAIAIRFLSYYVTT